MSRYAVALEPWSAALWAEMEAPANAHFEEVDGDVEPKRRFKLDLGLMQALADAGALKVVIAREAGRLVGYYTWNIMPDVESEGLLVGHQGAWYVRLGHPRAAYEMFHVAVAELKALGVRCIFPHHRTQGRGAHIGKFFMRQGAKDIQRTYSLWIGE